MKREEVYAQGRLKYDKPLTEEMIRSSKWLPLLQQSDLVVYWLLYQNRDGYAKKDLLAAGAREAIVVDGFPQVDLTKHWLETMAAGTGFPDLKTVEVIQSRNLERLSVERVFDSIQKHL